MRSEDQDSPDTGDWLEVLFALDSNNVGMDLEFENISLRKPKTRDFILSGVTGKAHSKSLTGIMGQSGSGKTTLTNILVGKVRADSGSLMLNKVPRDLAKGYHFPALIGFVPQDDIVHPHLTVFENILHSARVRLGGNLDDQAIQERVNLVIDGLGLTKVKSSVVGSPQKPIISGGERKRVSIGLELVAAPQVLILDEPTSGLDAQAALSIMALLKRFSKEGLTVICVVHQPRVEIFEALDSLLVLEQGQCIYSGKAMNAKQYFEDQGFHFNPTLNPADLIIDIASGKFEAGRTKLEEWKQPKSPNETMAHSSSGESDREHTDLSFRRIEADYNKRFAPWYRQIWLCILRDLLQQTRQLAVFVVEITGAALTGTLIGLVAHEFHGQVFQGIYLSPFSTLSSAVNYGTVTEIGVLTCLAISFSAAYPSVATFAEEELVFKRESHSGHSESAYFIGKAIAVLPRLFLAAIHFTTVYLVLATPFASFNMLLTLNFLYFYCIYGLGSVAIAISSPANSPLVCLLMAIVIAVLGGSQPRLATVKNWHLEWLWDMSPGLWFTEAVVNEHVKRLEYLYDMKVAGYQTGYTFGRTGFDSG
ncbi:hypothetical protein N7478_011927 [Penicillium angulare]|uniref:uncharacterized protein n=1 Tax=Penicillium angulare TaxID=116970 RepID=UPI0025402A10|nr:uncharacterized protein N7478_011927 [Penicillium angulare]KAJ5261332.1 hypothetical protein N7478_011927 [Penicillium angulare]